MGALMFVCLPLSTFARVEDVSSLSTEKTIDLANETEDLILTGINTSKGSVKLITVSGTDKVVILKDLSLDTSGLVYGTDELRAALSVIGTGNVTFELDGANILKSSYSHAGLEKGNDGSLTIKDDNGTSGSLGATGGRYGAGIGGGNGGDGTYITIENGTVTATGGENAAGIGGGYGGDGTHITIENGTVTATGGSKGAGIGGGCLGDGSNILIKNGTVTATGGGGGAGIGGGIEDIGEVTITGGTVIAIGGECAAGIGGGIDSDGSAITVSNDATIYAAGGVGNLICGEGAAIGEGGSNSYSIGLNYEEPIDGADVTPATSGLYTTGSITTFSAGTTVEQIKDNPGSGVTVRGTKPAPVVTDPATQQTTEEPTQTKELPQKKDPVKEDPNKQPPKQEQPPKKEIPVYTERSCIADVNVAALIAAALKADPNAKEITIEFGDNICLTPDLLKDLFADSRVSKNCLFTHKGKRYVLRVNTVNTASKQYADDFAALGKETDGMAGFLRAAEIFNDLNVTVNEIN